MSTDLSQAKRRRLSALESRQKGGTPPRAQHGGTPKRTTSRGSSLGPTEQGEPRGPAYDGLGPELTSHPVASALGLTEPVANPSSLIEEFLLGLLGSNANVADAGGAIADRVRGKVMLLDNPASAQAGTAKPGSASSKARRSRRHMSGKEHRQRESFAIPEELQRYELYTPLQKLWEEYIAQLMVNCSAPVIASRFLTADLHGCTLAVTASRQPTKIGLEGLVVRETENMFFIVSQANRLHGLRKHGATFRVCWQQYHVILHGNNLRLRSPKSGQQQRPQSISL